MQTNSVAPMLKKYIRPRQAAELLGVHRTTLWREVQRGNLPEPTHITRGAIGWPEEELVAAIAARQGSRG